MKKKWEYEKPCIEIVAHVEDLIKTSLTGKEEGFGGTGGWTG